MVKTRQILLGFEIDKLTNSIQNVISGDSFSTDVSLINKADLKSINKKVDGSLIGTKNLNWLIGMCINSQL